MFEGVKTQLFYRGYQKYSLDAKETTLDAGHVSEKAFYRRNRGSRIDVKSALVAEQ